jgi:hypothetical protein
MTLMHKKLRRKFIGIFHTELKTKIRTSYKKFMHKFK